MPTAAAGATPLELLREQQAAERAAARAKRAAARAKRAAARAAKRPAEAFSAAVTAAGLPTDATTAPGPVRGATDAPDATDHPGRAWEAGSLVSTAGHPPSDDARQEAAEAGEMKRLRLRDQRRRLREAIQRFTRLDGLRGCGTGLTGEAVGLHVGPAAARFAGLMSCHSVWACPVCQARIRAARAVELERAALAWLKAGHGLYMATLTVPHWEHVRLASRVKDGHKCAGQRSCTCPCRCPLLAETPDGRRPKCTCACPVDPGQLARVVEAWRGVQGGTWWTGRDVIRDGAPAPWGGEWEADPGGRYVRRQEFDGQGRPMGPATVWQEGFKDRWGIVGTTRTIEITWGANGWHSHAHVLLWTEEESTAARAEAIEEELFTRWAKRCKAVGLPKPARGEIRPQDGKRVGKGVDVTAATREQDGDVLGRYLVKLQEGGNLGMEMTRTDLKVARGQKGKTALELAAVAAAGNEQAIDLWREFEFATRGVQCLTWSQGLRERLAPLVELDDRDDDEIPEEEMAETPEAPSLMITRAAWWRAVVPAFGARADILHAAEVGGLPGAIAILDRLQLVQGVDYGPPEQMAGPVLPSVDQLRRGQQTRQARRDHRQAVDDAVYERTPAQWAAAAEKRRATIAAQKARAAAEMRPAVLEDGEHERQELANARAEFDAARAKARAEKQTETAAAIARFRQSA